MAVLRAYACWVFPHPSTTQTEMTAPIILRPEPLTSQVFSPYGQVLETQGVKPVVINHGNTERFGNLADVSLGDGGQGQISIYRSRPIELPFKIRLLERHPLASQAFYPLHQRPFPVIVASAMTCEALRVFMTNGHQGVNIRKGTWHHFQLTLGQESDYIVFDRRGDGDNCEETWLEEEVYLDL